MPQEHFVSRSRRPLLARSAATRAQLKGERDPSQRAVLEGRQKALKLTANALYGFTGAQVSLVEAGRGMR